MAISPLATQPALAGASARREPRRSGQRRRHGRPGWRNLGSSSLPSGTSTPALRKVSAPLRPLALPALTSGRSVHTKCFPAMAAPPRRVSAAWPTTTTMTSGQCGARLEAGCADLQRPGLACDTGRAVSSRRRCRVSSMMVAPSPEVERPRERAAAAPALLPPNGCRQRRSDSGGESGGAGTGRCSGHYGACTF